MYPHLRFSASFKQQTLYLTSEPSVVAVCPLVSSHPLVGVIFGILRLRLVCQALVEGLAMAAQGP